MPLHIDNQRFRVLKHLLILVFVPDPFPYPRGYVCHLHFANEKIQVEEHQVENGGTEKDLCIFYSSSFSEGHRKLTRVQLLCSSRRRKTERGSVARGLTTQVLKDIRIRQLICVPCYRPEEVTGRVIDTSFTWTKLLLLCLFYPWADPGYNSSTLFSCSLRTCPFGLPTGRWTQVCVSFIFHLPTVPRPFPRLHFSLILPSG